MRHYTVEVRGLKAKTFRTLEAAVRYADELGWSSVVRDESIDAVVHEAEPDSPALAAIRKIQLERGW